MPPPVLMLSIPETGLTLFAAIFPATIAPVELFVAAAAAPLVSAKLRIVLVPKVVRATAPVGPIFVTMPERFDCTAFVSRVFWMEFNALVFPTELVGIALIKASTWAAVR